MTDTYTKIEFYEKDNDRNKSLPKMSKKNYWDRLNRSFLEIWLEFSFNSTRDIK